MAKCSIESQNSSLSESLTRRRSVWRGRSTTHHCQVIDTASIDLHILSVQIQSLMTTDLHISFFTRDWFYLVCSLQPISNTKKWKPAGLRNLRAWAVYPWIDPCLMKALPTGRCFGLRVLSTGGRPLEHGWRAYRVKCVLLSPVIAQSRVKTEAIIEKRESQLSRPAIFIAQFLKWSLFNLLYNRF